MYHRTELLSKHLPVNPSIRRLANSRDYDNTTLAPWLHARAEAAKGGEGARRERVAAAQPLQELVYKLLGVSIPESRDEQGCKSGHTIHMQVNPALLI